MFCKSKVDSFYLANFYIILREGNYYRNPSCQKEKKKKKKEAIPNSKTFHSISAVLLSMSPVK